MTAREWEEYYRECADGDIGSTGNYLFASLKEVRDVIQEAEEIAKEYNGPLDGGLRLSLAHVKRLRKALGMKVEEE